MLKGLHGLAPGCSLGSPGPGSAPASHVRLSHESYILSFQLTPGQLRTKVTENSFLHRVYVSHLELVAYRARMLP